MRKLVTVLTAAVLLVSLGVGGVVAEGSQEKQPEVFRYGFLSSLSGTFAGVAETQRKSFILAVEEVNEKGGLDMSWGKVKIETFIGDDEAKLDVGVMRFREMAEKGIVALTGGIWNPMSAALNEDMKISPLIYVPGYVPAMDSYMEGNPSVCSYTPTFTPWSIGYMSGKAAIETLGKKTIYFLERADSWGHTIRMGLEAACAKYGGKIIGVSEVSAGTVDYTSIISKVIEAKPDVFITSMFGGDGVANLKQAYDMGLYDVTTVFSAWTANVVCKGIPAPALADSYALAWFYWNPEGMKDREIADKIRAYSDAYQKRWNEPPDNMGTAAYVASQIIFQAVQEADSFDPEKVGEVIRNASFDVVTGTVSFRDDHQPIGRHAGFLLRGKAPSDRSGDWDFFDVVESYGGDEVLPPLDVMGY